MLADLKRIVKNYKIDIVLIIVIILISLASFGLGYITAKLSEKKPLEIYNPYQYEKENIR
ncbi:hypothetical protein J7K03_00030 [bacterium]|nr:hypothetical protein [bacterium]HDJ30437.1 hypothetical protein [bacterium]